MINGIICHLCNAPAPRTGPVQKYCGPCSIVKDNERKTEWRLKQFPNRVPRGVAKQKSQEERDRLEKRGKLISSEGKRAMFWPANCDDDIVRMIRIAMPFTWDFSKNRLYTLGARTGHIALRAGMRRSRYELQRRIKEAVGSTKFFQGKVWIDILVQKPKNIGDAVNVVDAVCDAVKDAIEVDDKYFSIRKLDWEIVKENPMLYVGVGQSITEDNFCCTYCGRLQPMSEKSSHKTTCKDCRYDRKHIGETEAA